jgi:hypothetical protein
MKPSVVSRALSGSSSIDVSASSLATGRRSQDSAISSESSWSTLLARTGFPVSMHSV